VVGRWLMIIWLACDLTNDDKDRIARILLPSGASSGELTLWFYLYFAAATALFSNVPQPIGFADMLVVATATCRKPEGEDRNDGGHNCDHACDGTAVPPKSLDFLCNSELLCAAATPA
jgi:hypothetical protein